MSTIYKHIANATGKLDQLLELIDISFEEAVAAAEQELNADDIDIFFIAASAQAIPEYGIGGYSPSANHIYVSFDQNSKFITKDYLVQTLLHEMHHCMRWRDPGYVKTLGEAIVSEGMATLYESEHADKPPLYALVHISEDEIMKAKDFLKQNDDDHAKWFYGKDGIVRWFGYTYGYELCKRYANENRTTGRAMVHLNAGEVLKLI